MIPALRSLLLLLSVLTLASPIDARTVNVDTVTDDGTLTACDDATPNDCSLRGAINAAGAAAEHYDILLPAGTYATTAEPTRCPFVSGYGGSESETGTALCVHGDVSIIGAGAATTTVDGMSAGRIFMADLNTTTTISGVTITHGSSTGGSFLGTGGGILNHGTMTLADLVIAANVGDGIYNAGDLTVERCAITDNATVPSNAGGGIYNHAPDPPDLAHRKHIRIVDSTIARNDGGRGAGMDSVDAVVTVIGSTISDNTSTGAAGGIASSGGSDLRLVNTTVTGNSAKNGGGIYTAPGNCATCVVSLENVTVADNSAEFGGGMSISGTVKIRNTIVTGNTAPDGIGPNCLGSGYVSEGYNLLAPDPDANCHPTTGDLTGNQTATDPMLGALAFNGGPTETRAPLASSPALDHGSPEAPGEGGSTACAAVDQRRVLRPIGDRCDIGAVERAAALAVTTVTPARSGDRGGAILAIGGGGFAPGAAVVLRRVGQADVVADPVAIEAAGAALTASFDLTNAVLGAWDVVVTNPDTTTAVLAGGFTVEAVREPDVYAAVVGRSAARGGLPARYTIRYGNRGNIEALAVPLTLLVPATFAPTMRFEIAPPPAQPGRPFDDYSHVPLAVTTDVVGDQASLPFVIPIIPPGFTGILEFTLTPPAGIGHGIEFQIQAWLGQPWIEDGVVRPEVVADAAVRARTFANDRLGTTATAALDPVLIAYETNALTLAVASSRATLLNGFGQTGRAYSAAFLAIDLAGYAADQAVASETSVEGVWRRLGIGLGLLTAPVYAGGTCPPCLCSAQPLPGCSTCKDDECTPPIDPTNPPKAPKNPLSPADCRAVGDHHPTHDGSLCVPNNPKGCPVIPNVVFADPACGTYPLNGSIDPNDKTGSGGSGPQRYVPADTPMPYSIAFENLPAATAPAQTVVITDQLDTTTLDLATFTLGPIMVGDHVTITPPAGVTTFTGGADLRPARDVLLKVDAGLDAGTGMVTWTFTSLDPATLQPLDDPDGGFLPPNTDPPAGDGQVNFTIQPKTGLPSGTAIKNKAQVIFDFNAPIDTPEWLNTVDAAPPSSHVDSIDPATCGATDLTVHWSGTDAESEISTYSVFVSTDGGPYAPLVTDTTDTVAPFTGEVGKTYRFYATARDHAGNVEAAPADADVTRTVGACGIHDLAITAVTAPKRVALTAKKPTHVAKIAVQIENRSPQPETIADAAILANLVTLEVASLAETCAAPTVTLHAGPPQKKLPVTIKSKKKLKVLFDVTIACANDPAKGAGHEDYRVSARVDHSALGEPDVHPVDDVCPRTVTPPIVDPYPDGKIHEKGCGAKKADKTLGGDIVVDVTVK